jgi:hypothetical protein
MVRTAGCGEGIKSANGRKKGVRNFAGENGTLIFVRIRPVLLHFFKSWHSLFLGRDDSVYVVQSW